MKKASRAIVIIILISLVFVVTVALSILDAKKLKTESNRYIKCDVVTSIDKTGGISILQSENAELILPDNTEIHVVGVHLDGFLEVDHVDVEISDEVIEYYQDHPAYSIVDPNIDERAEMWAFYRRIKVSDVDSEELAQLYDKLCEKHNNFDIYVAVSVILASLVYFCPVVIVTVRAVKRSEYGAVALIVPLLSLVISLLVLRYTFLAFVG